jgi:hypothetical protein
MRRSAPAGLAVVHQASMRGPCRVSSARVRDRYTRTAHSWTGPAGLLSLLRALRGQSSYATCSSFASGEQVRGREALIHPTAAKPVVASSRSLHANYPATSALGLDAGFHSSWQLVALQHVFDAGERLSSPLGEGYASYSRSWCLGSFTEQRAGRDLATAGHMRDGIERHPSLHACHASKDGHQVY